MPRIRGIPILNFPVIAGSIPSPAPWIITQTLTFTTVSGANTLTAGVTTNLNIGQPITGTGIPPNTYLASITSGTAGTMNNNATASGSPSLTFGQIDPVQSPSGLIGPNAWAGFPLPPLVNQSNVFNDVNGCLFETPNIFVIPISGNLVLPPGEGMMLMGAQAAAAGQYQLFQGTSAPAWTTIGTGSTTLSTLFPFMSDGANARVLNGITNTLTVTLYQWR